MKRSGLYAMMLGGILMASCTDNIYDAPRVETVQKEYARSFQDLIGGPVARTQDFVVAKQDSVSVTLAAAGDVKIYTRNGQKNSYQLVGHYEDLSAGAHVLKFDTPEDVVEFAVEAGCVVKKTAGEALSFDNTPFSRTYMKGEEENVFSVFEEESGDSIIKVFTIAEIKAFGDILPPGRITLSDGTITSSVQRILDGSIGDDVHIDFKVQNDLNKVVRVYPVYWIASYRHEFGIFTYTVDGEIDQKYPIYRSRLGEDVQVSFDGANSWENATVTDSPIYAYYLDEYQRGTETEPNPVPTHVRSRGFRVTLPTDGQVYGFYIDVYPKNDTDPDTNKHYFEADAPTYQWYSDAKFNSDDSFHAAFFEADVPGTNRKRTFLGFEDNVPWDRTTNKGGDEDLNDFMFIVEPEPTIIDHTEHEWILAAEDLGDLDDFDFNDVVVSVSKLAGQTEMNVTAKAAGGTLPVWLTYNDQVVKPEGVEDDGEFHSWFSGSNSPDEEGLYPMLNTGRSSKRDGKTAVIKDVPKTYSITHFSKPDPETGFKGFQLKVEREDGTFDYITLPAHDPENGVVGMAPQMMCLPGGWKWPLERVKMVDAYPQFGEWGTGYQTTLDWQNNYNAGKVVSY